MQPFMLSLGLCQPTSPLSGLYLTGGPVRSSESLASHTEIVSTQSIALGISVTALSQSIVPCHLLYAVELIFVLLLGHLLSHY